jgi:hypothetical protein
VEILNSQMIKGHRESNHPATYHKTNSSPGRVEEFHEISQDFDY